MIGVVVALGCGDPSSTCGHYPLADFLRYIIFFLAVATLLFAIMQFIGKFLYGRSGQMDSRLAYMQTFYLIGVSNIFLFTEIGRLGAKPTWRLYLTLIVVIIGLVMTIMMMRGEFKSTEDADVSQMSSQEIKDFVHKPKYPNKTVRRRAGRR